MDSGSDSFIPDRSRPFSKNPCGASDSPVQEDYHVSSLSVKNQLSG